MKKELETLAIDIDEVLLDTLRSFLEVYNRNNETDFKREDFYDYIWQDILRISREQAIHEFYEFMQSKEGLEMPQIPGAKNALDELKLRYKLVSATNRSEDFREVTLEQLKLNFQDAIPPNLVYFGNHYSRNGNNKSKADLLKESGATRLIEDQYPVALECASRGIQVYMLDSPWNQKQIPINLPIIRVYDWTHILEELS